MVLIRNAQVHGQPGLDVRAGPDAIEEIGPRLARNPGEEIVDAAGGAVIPGLHDHHVHLRAVVAARQSADAATAADPAGFDALIRASAAGMTPGRWLRITGWDEDRAGPLDRRRLDALTGAVPVRVQHRSGAMWVLNSAALQAVDAARHDLPGIERDVDGAPTGRLLRLDQWLRDRLPAAAHDDFAPGLAAYAARAASLGVTGFTDATPGRDQADIDAFCALAQSGALPQRLVLMAPPGGRPGDGGRVALGPHKIILDDAMLPTAGELAATIAGAHEQGSAVAVHCVTADQLVVAAAAFEQAGRVPALADRIEHAGIVPPGYARVLARLGLTAVTQPGFIRQRGDAYLARVPAPEQAWLYPCASLLEAGVTVAGSTDAPFGPGDPWECIAVATTRRSSSGRLLGPSERVPAAQALRLFLADPLDPRRTRTVAAGQPADLCILHAPLPRALEALHQPPAASVVRATIADGQLIAR
jgi:predicted amidohydrolase YtcJ